MIPALATNIHASILASAVATAGDVLDHLATCPDGTLDETAFCAAVPAAAEWLASLDEPLSQLLRKTTQADRAALAEAYTNDVHFDVDVDSSTFQFLYPGLPKHVQEAAKPLFNGLYDALGDGGIPVANATGGMVDRERLEHGFFESNPRPRACPACLEHELIPKRGRASTVDCDHFLPKSIYAPLAIHPGNLVFICLECNQRRKGRRDPLTGALGAAGVAARGAAGAVRRTYVPYHRPAAPELELEFARGAVELKAGSADARVRVENLDRVLDLADTWSAYLSTAEHEMLEDLEDPPTPASVKGLLDSLERKGSGPVETLLPGRFLRGRYAAHLRDAHLDTLVAEWRQTLEERATAATLHPPT